MLKSRRLVISFGFFSFLITGLSAVAQTAEKDCRNGDYYTTAIHFMRALYPELLEKGVTVQVGAFQPFEADRPSPVFDIWVSEVRPTEPIKASPNISSAERVGHLSTHYQFDPRDDQILWMTATGSFVNIEKYQALTNLVDEHPEWDETHMTQALTAAGAKFGPDQKQALLLKFPTSQLEAVLGKIEIQSAQFVFHANAEPPLGATLRWTIRFHATMAAKTNAYFVSMEPFEGRVVMPGRGLSGK